jgi:hypothetical protein
MHEICEQNQGHMLSDSWICNICGEDVRREAHCIGSLNLEDHWFEFGFCQACGVREKKVRLAARSGEHSNRN